jgi:hypothetical protein
MLPPFADLAAPPLFLALGAAYAAAGALTAGVLARKGEPAGTIATALVAWPLLLPALAAPEPRTPARGPLGPRIDAALDALEATLRDPAAGDVGDDDDTRVLRHALHQADERLALVDRLLADDATADPTVADGVASLRAARDHAAAEIEAVLSALTQLRIQVGLLTLAGNAAPVRDKLRELRMRIGALDEVGRAAG